MALPERIHLPFFSALSMIWNYAKSRIIEQIKAVAFIIIYLVLFKIVILKTPPANALQISVGIGLVVLGLSVFLEGLFLGLMPLGEKVGLKLPQKCHISIILIFSFFLGICSTLAEPAITSLKLAGITATPWETPLLYRILEINTTGLVMAVGIGVGCAVAAGMARFYWGLAIRPFVYVLVPLLLILSAIFTGNRNLADIINLAWDTGGVTTGPVTVPLVLAMGIGISRASGRQENQTASFGVVALASLFPVIGVMILAAWLNTSTPLPMSEKDFFSLQNRKTASILVPTAEKLEAIAFQRGTVEGRRAFYADDAKYQKALASLADPAQRTRLLGSMSLSDWLSSRAAPSEKAAIALDNAGKKLNSSDTALDGAMVLKTEAKAAFYAVVPLVAMLLIVLFVFLRDRLRHGDELALGIVFSLVGMCILTSGIRLGFSPLGDQVGRPLPRVFKSETHEEGRIILEPFDISKVQTAYTQNGYPEQFFYMKDRQGNPKAVQFDPDRYDAREQRYEHIVERPPLFGPELTLVGVLLVFIFAFGMGYGSTVAEPALNALGKTVEEITVGTITRVGVVRTVSLGVGIGLLAGVARILYSIPVVWLLAPSYLLTLILTIFSTDDFAGIAWDSGGVTTGPITVPLVLAMGLGIGGGLNVVDGFGIVAMASVFPTMSMLIYGFIVQMRQRQAMPQAAEEAANV